MVLDKGIQLVIDMPQDDDVDTGMGKRSLITSKQAAEAKKKKHSWAAISTIRGK